MSSHYKREQIDALVSIAGGTDKARAILEALGAKSGLSYLQKSDEIHYARSLLQQGIPRVVIIPRLMQRFALVERTAWRRASSALEEPLT